MIVNHSIILLLFLLGLLIISITILVLAFIEELKKKSDESLIFILLSGLPIMFIIPVILELIQQLS